jgi:hypothetical protein
VADTCVKARDARGFEKKPVFADDGRREGKADGHAHRKTMRDHLTLLPSGTTPDGHRVEHIASCVFAVEFGKRGSSWARHKARLILSDPSNAAGSTPVSCVQPVLTALGEEGRYAGKDAKPFACGAPALDVKMTREHQKAALASKGAGLPVPP